MELFSITCTTCRARLKVRDPAVIGEILICPKCQSMVQATPPPGWEMPAEWNDSTRSSTMSGSSEAAQSSEAPHEATPSAEAPAPAARPSAWATTPYNLRRGVPATPPTPAAPAPQQPSVPDVPASPEPAAAPSAAPPWLSLTEQVWRRVILWTAAPAASVLVSLAVWHLLAPPGGDIPAPAAQAEAGDTVTSATVAAAQPAETPRSPRRPTRRIAPGSSAVLMTRTADTLRWPEFRQPLLSVIVDSGAAADALTRAARIDPQQCDEWTISLPVDSRGTPRLIAAHWPAASEHAQQAFAGLKPLDLHVAGSPCFVQPGGAWPHPFALVEGDMLLSGSAEVLAEMNGATGSQAGGLLEELLAELADRHALVYVAKAEVLRPALRTAAGHLFRRWSQAADDWQLLADRCAAVGVGIDLQHGMRSVLLLRAENASTADQLHAAAQKFLASFETSLAAEPEQTVALLRAGGVDRASAASADWLNSALLAALRARTVELDDVTVRITLRWESDLQTVLAASGQSAEAVMARGMQIGRQIDEQNHRLMLESLAGYEKTEQSLPAAAAGAALLPPETRLSWLASLAPYFGHLDWQRQFQFGRPWNDAANANITRRPLEAAINPLLGPSTTAAGFPVTHYAGLAGVGSDAAELPVSHARAGLFGYSRQTSTQRIADGAANTIAVVGVQDHLGPWAQGGSATVRAFTERPYVNGPDGIGSGQPGGMYVGMADGSVRFLSADIDPGVLEMLASANDGRPMPLALRDVAPQVDERSLAAEPALPADDEPLPAAQPPRAELPQVDVEERLAQPIAALKMDDVPLLELVRLLEQLAGLTISFDMEALRAADIELRTPVSVNVTNATLGQVLQQVLDDLQLVRMVSGGQLVLTQSRDVVTTVNYTVADLVAGNPQGAQELGELVTRFIEPYSWREGEQGQLEVLTGKLHVRHNVLVQHQVGMLLEQLRAVQSRQVAGQDAIDDVSRWGRAHSLLSMPVTANFRQPAPLMRILSYLREATGADLVFDGVALSQEGIDRNMPVTLVVNQQPLGAALDDLLAPIGLQFEFSPPQTIEIVDAPSYNQRMRVDVYPIADLLTMHGSAATVAEKLQADVAPTAWEAAGGEAVVAPYGEAALIVRASPAVQRQINDQLAKWRAGKQ